jgi:cysteine sulfinate desulfinase/cysteine desulfurase-like protein
MGVPPSEATSTLRFSFLRGLTASEVDTGLERTAQALEHLYALAPSR